MWASECPAPAAKSQPRSWLTYGTVSSLLLAVYFSDGGVGLYSHQSRHCDNSTTARRPAGEQLRRRASRASEPALPTYIPPPAMHRGQLV